MSEHAATLLFYHKVEWLARGHGCVQGPLRYKCHPSFQVWRLGMRFHGLAAGSAFPRLAAGDAFPRPGGGEQFSPCGHRSVNPAKALKRAVGHTEATLYHRQAWVCAAWRRGTHPCVKRSVNRGKALKRGRWPHGSATLFSGTGSTRLSRPGGGGTVRVRIAL